MRLIDFLIYYCMQNFKGGNFNFKTPLGRACGAIGFIIGSLVIVIVELTLRLSTGYQLIDHKYPFIITSAVIILSANAITYYIYHNKKRYQFISSSQYRPFQLTDTFGFIVTFATFLLSFIFMIASTIYISDYL